MTDLLLIATGIFEQRNDNHYDLTNNAQVHHISDENSLSWVRKYLIPRAYYQIGLKNVNSIEAFSM